MIFSSGDIKRTNFTALPPRDTDKLGQRIEIEANLLRDGALVRRVMAEMRRSMQLCVDRKFRNGEHTKEY